LLLRLRDAQGAFVTPAELGMKWPAWQLDLDELDAFGFALERHPALGIAYRGPADRLCPDQIEHDLGTRLVGRRVAVWDRVTSTNDLAARAALSTANGGLVVLAEDQSAGRGSRGRAWLAPARSSLLMSVLLFPPPPLADFAWLTALGAVAAAEVVAEWTGRTARIKWPIGLNANIVPEEFPRELRETATSLQILLSRRVDRSELARALIRRLDDHYERGHRHGPASLNGPWREWSEHRHRAVRIETRQGPHQGRLADLDLQRGLTLEQLDGQRCQIRLHNVLALDPAEDIERLPPGQIGLPVIDAPEGCRNTQTAPLAHSRTTSAAR
jgi:BirA family biotin operon repressor/biotin-[acetyl-CoA-carboxylase] ligase